MGDGRTAPLGTGLRDPSEGGLAHAQAAARPCGARGRGDRGTARLRLEPPRGAEHLARPGGGQHGHLCVDRQGRPGRPHGRRQLDSRRGAGQRPELPRVRRPRPLLRPHRQHRRRSSRRQLPVPVQDADPEQGVVPVRPSGRQRVQRLQAERRPAVQDRSRDVPLSRPARRADQGEDDRQRPAGGAAEHRPEDVPELPDVRGPVGSDALRRHEGVRRAARRSVLRRPGCDVRRDQRPQAHRQPG